MCVMDRRTSASTMRHTVNTLAKAEDKWQILDRSTPQVSQAGELGRHQVAPLSADSAHLSSRLQQSQWQCDMYNDNVTVTMW